MRRIFELQDSRHARLLPMEGLRGLAVILVFLQHYGVQAQLIGVPPGLAQAVAAAFRSYGNLGVELFFVLSGYLIYGTLVRRAPPFVSFMLRRAQRIYPTFLVVFAFALALTILTPIPDRIPPGTLPAILYLLANLALLPGLFPITAIVNVAWSLSYEAFFYLVTAAAVLGAGLHRIARDQRVAILWAVSAGFLLACYAGSDGFPVRMMPFFAGMLLAEGLGRGVPPWLGWAAPVAAVALSQANLGLVTGELCWTLALFALCAVCFRGVGAVSAWMVWAPLRWLGNMSYSYYLIHGFVVRIAMVVLARVLGAGMPDALFWGMMPVLFLATLVASAVLFIVVEKPFSLRTAAPAVNRTVSA